MRFLFLLLFAFSAQAQTFLEEYSGLVDIVVEDIEKNCKKKIKKNIKYKWMPKGLEYIEPSLAFVSFHSDEEWIEFRSSFRQLLNKDKKLILYHEIGHLYGLQHQENSIMTNPIEKVVADYEAFFIELCPKML